MELKYSKEIYDHFKLEEGYRTHSYKDTKGLWTIGIGHLLGGGNEFSDVVWNDEQIIQTFESDISHCFEAAHSIFPEYDILPQNVRLGILDMIYNLGPTGFRGFKTTIQLIHAGRFQDAANAALDSKWARIDVPHRAERVAKLISNT